MDSNVFGGVTTKLSDLMTLEEQIKFKLVDVKAHPQVVATSDYSHAISKIKRIIERPISQFDAYRAELKKALPNQAAAKY